MEFTLERRCLLWCNQNVGQPPEGSDLGSLCAKVNSLDPFFF